ncbi:phosphoadenosine phosphosulfate reductase [Planctomycetales bacterium]|nr:phosphoadenosine phosphosulfate reductase [Planctomycetales bacterium]GHT07603.1 phosphoadenosine phosphosulfate reductase [Planctomycetales bacterium]
MSATLPAACAHTIEILPRLLHALRPPLALAFSYQTEDVAALHLLKQLGVDGVEIFTLNTGKLFPEIAGYHLAVEKFFGVKITPYHPDGAEEKELADLGEFGMRASLDNRHRCCEVRKVRPLARALSGKNAWLTGLRAAQAVTRQNLGVLEYDEKNHLIKINPLIAWSDADLAAYREKFSLPENPLYARGFKSIGCEPCTRPVRDGEDLRAGRWWWENPEHKECGLHLKKINN